MRLTCSEQSCYQSARKHRPLNQALSRLGALSARHSLDWVPSQPLPQKSDVLEPQSMAKRARVALLPRIEEESPSHAG